MSQQTPVEWLWRWQMDNEFASFEQGVSAYRQAKAMEKEQIKEAYNMGTWNKDEKYKNGEQYYNETYNE